MNDEDIKIGDVYYIDERSSHYKHTTALIIGNMFNQKQNYYPCLVENERISIPLWDIKKFGRLVSRTQK